MLLFQVTEGIACWFSDGELFRHKNAALQVQSGVLNDQYQSERVFD